MNNINLISSRVMGLVLAAFLLLGFAGVGAAEQELSVQAAVESREVMVGEPFILQIQVAGDDNPARPDLSGLTDFTVQDMGGQQNSSQSITIVNGKYTQISSRGYLFNYQLTAKRAGNLIIPAINAVAGGRTFSTGAITIKAREPEESDDFKLAISLPKDRAYVGEPLILTVTWYVGKECQDVNFTIPLFQDPTFVVGDLPLPVGTDQNSLLRLILDGREIIAVRGRGVLEGREFTTVTFRQVVIPTRAGSYAQSGGTVSCKVLTGYRRQSRFNDSVFNDFFGGGRQGVYQTEITPAPLINLTVSELPAKGKPPGFTGPVGQFSMIAEAQPVKVRVGDPITLTIHLTGPEYLDNLELPPLTGQPALNTEFKVPQAMAPGELKGRSKVFTQTIRAKHGGVKAIPPVSFAFFNPRSGRYETIESRAIPIQVEEVRTVTANDALGTAGPQVVAGTELKVSDQGIAFNYEDDDLLVPIPSATPGVLFSKGQQGLLILLPFFYLLLAMGRVWQKKRDPARSRSRRAAGEFTSALTRLNGLDSLQVSEGLLVALRNYLGAKLRQAGVTLTVRDLEPLLKPQGVALEIIAGLEDIFQQCEALRYGGKSADGAELCRKAGELIRKLDREL
ncbi:MAG: BatD family protein [Proteobacteria bacterium]|nr:BatD family protein [Pseudomonadota bacterium]MBU1688132.1 BatD family protein [Pseudomonadota bacterium]